MKIALLASDGREVIRRYERTETGFGTAPDALLQGFAGMTGVEIHVVSCTQQPTPLPAQPAANIHFHNMVVPRIGWMRTAYQGCIRAVRRKLREIRPDIVHGQGTERDCGISAVLSGYPNVLTIHGNIRTIARLNHARPFSFQWNAARLEEFTIPRSDGIVCITDYTRESVASLARKTWLVPNAVNQSFFEIKRVPTPLPQILCVGSVEQRKNQNALIRAVETLDPKNKLQLVFIGGAHRENAYGREFLELVEARPWCRYVGSGDHNLVKRHLAEATGLALASLEDNCPMVILEAMAAGVPVAAARVGGIPELIRHEENGLLFDPLNPKDMATVIKRLALSDNQAMGTRAQTEARKRFHPQSIARQHIEIYEEVISARRR